MTNQEYWHNRAIEDEKRIYKLTLDEIKKQEDIYKNAKSQLNKTIREYTTKFSDNNGISYIQAKRLLNKGELEEFKYTVDEYIEKAKKIGLDYKEKQKLINSSLKHRIDKLEAMNYEIDMQLELLAHTKEQMTNNHLSKVYEEQYYRNLYNNAVATNTTKFISELNPQEIQSAIKSTWLINDTNFSGIIWKNKAKLKDELQKTIVTSLVTGKTPNQLCDELARRLEVDKGRAKTLLHTETARVRSLATNESYKELEVEKYQIIATLDDRTSDICQAMDLKVFNMKDYEVGVTANPFHCNCRTTTAPYFEDTTDRIARDNNETVYVPSDMSYGEYKAKYITNDIEKLYNKGYNKDKQAVVEYRLADEKLADELQVKSDEWFRILTQDEKEAIKDYTDTYYTRINRYLRGEDVSEYFDDYYTKQDLEKSITNLDKALSKFKLQENVTFYRGVSREELEYLKTSDTLKAYTSLTTDKENVAKDFSEEKNNGEIVLFRISKNIQGAYIGLNSSIPTEREFLLSKNTKYSIKKLNNHWEVTVYE